MDIGRYFNRTLSFLLSFNLYGGMNMLLQPVGQEVKKKWKKERLVATKRGIAELFNRSEERSQRGRYLLRKKLTPGTVSAFILVITGCRERVRKNVQDVQRETNYKVVCVADGRAFEI
ncbi:uncharacterized protein LOC122565762 [Bombus pyrosoma]|uniref:uncharacterized protein LOC122565762 n=1 Tax=Bombus pyrosoma TaxID=396416 RepID=UPI001CB9A806|nr:uncharacterized protein LOC122565762 [Bombus pyrosoma]